MAENGNGNGRWLRKPSLSIEQVVTIVSVVVSLLVHFLATESNTDRRFRSLFFAITSWSTANFVSKAEVQYLWDHHQDAHEGINERLNVVTRHQLLWKRQSIDIPGWDPRIKEPLWDWMESSKQGKGG